MSNGPDPHALPDPTIAEVAAVLHQLHDAIGLPDEHPDRIAAIAAKRAILRRILNAGPGLFPMDDEPMQLACPHWGCRLHGELVTQFGFSCTSCGNAMDRWPLDQDDTP